MNETITVVRYELSLNDLLTGELNEATEAANKLEGGLKNVAKQADAVGDKADKIEEAKKKLEDFGEAAGKIGEAFGVSFDPSKGLDFIKEAGEDYEKLQRAQSQVEAGLESTQHAAGLSFGELKEQAEQAGNRINFSAEQITNMQALLLTFPAVTKQTFADASTAIEDMAAKTGQDLNTTAKQVGLALQVPSKGLTTLGLNFTDSQEQVIKKLAETGHTAQAQAIIINELNSKFAGSAAAAAATDPYFKFKGSIDEVKTSIGYLVSKIKENLAPMLEFVAGKVAAVVGWMTKHKTIVEAVAAVIAPLVGTILGIAAAIQTWTTVQKILDLTLKDNPVGIIIAAIGALTGAVIYCWTHFAKFRAFLTGMWEFLKAWFQWLYDTPIKILKAFGEIIEGLVYLDTDKMTKGWQHAKSVIFDGAKNLGTSFKKGYDEGLADFATDHANGNAPREVKIKSTGDIKGSNSFTPSSGTETQGATGNKSTATTINIKIGDLVKELNVHSTTIQSGAKQIQQLITEVLLGAVNDSQRIAHD